MTGNRYVVFAGDSIFYDADGNVTKKKSPLHTREYFWSADNQLDSASLDGSSFVKYAYNAFGKPVIKYTRTSSTGWSVDSYFIWDGEQLLLDLGASGNRRADYAYFPGTIDNPAAQTIGATSATAIRDFQVDGIGNVIGTTAGTAASQTVSYDAWGTPTISGNTDNKLFWKGLFWQDSVVSLYYVRNRWYDPETGRFVNEDLIGHAGGENLYAFASNDPVNESDPSGMNPCSQAYLDLGYHTSFGDDGSTWCISPGAGVTLPPVIVWAQPDAPRTSDDPKSPFNGFGGGGDFRGHGGGSSWGPSERTSRTCSVISNLGMPIGGYEGAAFSYFIGYGVTGALGVVWDAKGPGIYLRGGAGLGFQGSAGTERGIVLGTLNGVAAEAEAAGISRGANVSVGSGGATVSAGPRINALPMSGHVAGTYTQVWRVGQLCGQ